jgi:hypothetical protein
MLNRSECQFRHSERLPATLQLLNAAKNRTACIKGQSTSIEDASKVVQAHFELTCGVIWIAWIDIAPFRVTAGAVIVGEPVSVWTGYIYTHFIRSEDTIVVHVNGVADIAASIIFEGWTPLEFIPHLGLVSRNSANQCIQISPR